MRASVFPGAGVRQEQVQEGNKVMSPAKRDGLLLEDSLQVLLSALLCVESSSLVIGVLPRPQLAASGGEVTLGFFDPTHG